MKHSTIRKHTVTASKLLLAGCMSCLLVACETTGDPTQGGLFGWSETKAIERQQALRRQLEITTAGHDAERERQQSLQARRSSLQRDVAARDQQLRVLEQEIAALRAALQSGSISAQEASARADSLRGRVNSATGAGSEKLRADFALINEQIELLTR